ncbi:phosphohydrolase [Shewanella colwelliana]|uniref:Phosphohydrolase n=1 Tax=Shewanella colwelliana TaxID=23 RepID=A0A1E5IPI5_SHECO|nr:HD domain-containing phosphohydrolase [Shewanella colwelliana]OEG72397.1 phosphohydrolase [Shewanella colwelliana]
MPSLHFPPSPHHSLNDSLTLWRKQIFSRLFGLLAIFCVPVYFTSVYLCIEQDLWVMALFDTFAYGLLLYILLAPAPTDRQRFTLGCFLAYSIGVAFVITIGPTGAGFFWLFVFPPLSSILLGKKAGNVAQIINASSLVVIGIGYSANVFQWPLTQGYSPLIWYVVSINFVVTNAMLTLSTSFLLGKLTRSLQSTLASRQATVMGLAKLAEYRDNETGAHLIRIQHYANMLAKQLKSEGHAPEQVTDSFIKEVTLSAILHDIGKVGIADAILLKPGRLSPAEFEQIKAHCAIGHDVLNSLGNYAPQCQFIRMGKEIAGGHHEKWDGSGYPNGLSGDDIPLSARLVALVDVYDALTSPRCYKRPLSHQEAVASIVGSKGTHFDPTLVDSFMAIHHQFEKLSSASLAQ